MSLMALGEPYVAVCTPSDYWLYATLFSSTCPVAVEDARAAGVAIAFRSQDRPEEVYIQDVMVYPEYRRRGLAGPWWTRWLSEPERGGVPRCT